MEANASALGRLALNDVEDYGCLAFCRPTPDVFIEGWRCGVHS